ncbi:NADP-specific glutamate dehydrogenase [Aurantivibrio plasticivorans]
MNEHATKNQQAFYEWLETRNPNQPEFVQAVKELSGDVFPIVEDNKHYQDAQVLQRLSEPDRVISFRVCWQADDGTIQINRGWRVQHSGLIGPYKGGIRFHPSVNESILKFLGFEQTFKNALTGLSLGGAKGGADFNPQGHSDAEIMRFCQAFMNELYRHIGETKDVPAGDINVSSREIGYLFGQYRRLVNNFAGALTGKDIEFGGSHVRVEATGYGLMYFVKEMLEHVDEKVADKRICISGAGNVALHAALKAIDLGATVLTLSSSQGVLQHKKGFSEDDIRTLLSKKGSSSERLKSLVNSETISWHDDQKPWSVECDIALPCATQNELDGSDAKKLIENGCRWVAEGANMPCTADAIDAFEDACVPHVPGKASNAGGVALSGLEMAQNAAFVSYDFDNLDKRLQDIMANIHKRCTGDGKLSDGKIHYRRGANIAAFKRVADALVAQGIG